jgi:hypothetical protein
MRDERRGGPHVAQNKCLPSIGRSGRPDTHIQMPAKILRFVSRGMQNYINWKMSCYTPEQLKAAADCGRELTARIERDEFRFPHPRSESQRAGDHDDLS